MPRHGPGVGIRRRTTKAGQVAFQVSHHANGRRYWKTFPTRKEARDWKEDMLVRGAAGTLGGPTSEPLKFQDVVRLFVAAMRRRLAAATVKYYRGTLGAIWVRRFTGRAIDGIGVEEIHQVLEEFRRKGHKRRSLEIYRQVLMAMLKWALKRGYLNANARDAKLPPSNEPPRVTSWDRKARIGEAFVNAGRLLLDFLRTERSP